MAIESFEELELDLEHRMEGAIDNLKKELNGLRTGRASAALLEPVMVEAYGAMTPLNQIGSVSVPEARLLSVSIWDKSMVKAAEKAIRDAGLGLNPASDGTLIRIPIPPLNEERRRELTKVAGKYAEQTRIAIRNVRRDGMDTLKKMKNDNLISEDEQHTHGDDVQKITDNMIKAVDQLLADKEKDIMQV
jgi:ribosome recycling factor